jgi:hypothetical protein
MCEMALIKPLTMILVNINVVFFLFCFVSFLFDLRIVGTFYSDGALILPGDVDYQRLERVLIDPKPLVSSHYQRGRSRQKELDTHGTGMI